MCRTGNYSGQYEERHVAHTVRFHGRLLVIDRVPAEVCSICGDVLLKPETVRHIERLLRTAATPAGSVPLYDYA